MRVGVIGTGYVGLVTGACFAGSGVSAICVDSDKKKIVMLKRGNVPFYEEGLENLLRRDIAAGRISFTTKVADAVKTCEVIIIAVGTPQNGDGSSNLRHIDSVARQIATHINDYRIIVTKSTAPVGTSARIKQLISSNRSGARFDVVSNPEFLREGSAIKDFLRPGRVVIGADSDKALQIIKDLYSLLYREDVPFVVTDTTTAELIKYAANCFLATKISYINEMANLCDAIGADVGVVAKAMGLDGRINPHFLNPGPGFGGGCLPKDMAALMHTARDSKVRLSVIEAAYKSNDRQIRIAFRKIKSSLGKLDGRRIALLGLSYKPMTDDVRKAPAINLAKSLLNAGAEIRAYDPAAARNAKAVLPDMTYCRNPYLAVKGADAVVVVTEWNEFADMDMNRIISGLREPFFFDLRNMYDAKEMKRIGFKYFCIGRPT